MSVAEKTQRLEARITSKQKELFKRAAALRGRNLTEFVVAAVQEAAQLAVREHDEMKLSQRDAAVFVKALLSPPEPNASLKRAHDARRKLIQ